MVTDQALPNLAGSVFWLIPSEPFGSFYKKEIERLSVRYNTTSFTPHLTLGRFTNDSVNERTFNHLGSHFSRLNTHVVAVHTCLECRLTPYQNLIQVLKFNHDIKQFISDLGTMIPGFEPSEDYHVSLMYGEIPCSVLESEIFDLSKRLSQTVTFSKIRAVKINGQPSSWQTLWEEEF